MAVNESSRSGGIPRMQAILSYASWAKILPFLVGIVAFIARIPYIGRSFDIFIDEVTYLRISRAVGFTQRVELADRPFLLHPPLWFIIEGGYIRLFNVTGNLITQIHATRILVALFAAISAALVFLIVRRAAGGPAALVAAAVFTLDPFVIKLNSLNMLETSAITWVLAGYWMVISELPTDDDRPLPWRRLVPALMAEGEHPLSVVRLVLAGLFFGLALLTKETMVLVTLAPLAIFAVLRWPLARRDVAIVSMVAAELYSLYVLVVALSGHWPAFISAKTRGLERFAGLVLTTGFKRPGGPSLAETLIDRMVYYGSTYLLIALGLIAILILMRRGGTISRVIAVWVLCTYGMLSYAILFGTLEEQFFYYLVVACIIANAAAAKTWLPRLDGQGVGRTGLAVAALLGLIGGFSALRWVDVRTTPDNGYANILAHLQENVPRGKRVASTSETGQYVLQGYLSGPWGSWDSPEQLKVAKPDFVLVTPRTVRWNNAHSADALLNWIDQNGVLVHSFTGREDNLLQLYRLPWASNTARQPAPLESRTATAEGSRP